MIEGGYSYSVSFDTTHTHTLTVANNKIAEKKSAHNIKVSHDSIQYPVSDGRVPHPFAILISSAALMMHTYTDSIETRLNVHRFVSQRILRLYTIEGLRAIFYEKLIICCNLKSTRMQSHGGNFGELSECRR